MKAITAAVRQTFLPAPVAIGAPVLYAVVMADYVIIGSPDHGEDNRRSIAGSAREALAMYCDTIGVGFREDQVKVAGPDGTPLTRQDLERLAEADQDA